MARTVFVWSALCLSVGCGKIELVGGNNDGGGNNNDGGNNLGDILGPQGDLAGQPIGMVTVTADDQPAGEPKFLPLAGVGVRLDSAGSMDPKGMTISYAWSVLSAPSGSTVTTTTLEHGDQAVAGFVPDRGGTYTLALNVSTPDSRGSATNFNVEVTTAPIFYDAITLTANVLAGITPTLIRSDGQNKKAVGCTVLANASLGEALLLAGVSSLVHNKVLEPAIATNGTIGPSRFLRSTYQLPNVDLGRNEQFDWRLSLIDEDTDCTTKPAVAVPQPMAEPLLAGIWAPDGSKLLYVQVDDIDGSNIGTTYSVATATGASPQVTAVTGLETLTLAPTEPAWIDNNTILFLAITNAPTLPHTYQLYKAKLTGAVASDIALWSDCTSVSGGWGRVRGLQARGGNIAYLGINIPDPPDGDLDGRGSNVWRFDQTGGTSCAPVNLTMAPEGGNANDFAVSPDGKLLAYAKAEVVTPLDMHRSNQGPIPTDIWILDTTNPGNARTLAGQPDRVDLAPRFIAGGRQVVFLAGPTAAALGNQPDMGPSTVTWSGISVVNIDGSNLRSLVGGTTTIAGGEDGPTDFDGPILGGNFSLLSVFGGCAIDPLANPLSSVAMGILLAVAILLGVRRSKRPRA